MTPSSNTKPENVVDCEKFICSDGPACKGHKNRSGLCSRDLDGSYKECYPNNAIPMKIYILDGSHKGEVIYAVNPSPILRFPVSETTKLYEVTEAQRSAGIVEEYRLAFKSIDGEVYLYSSTGHSSDFLKKEEYCCEGERQYKATINGVIPKLGPWAMSMFMASGFDLSVFVQDLASMRLENNENDK